MLLYLELLLTSSERDGREERHVTIFRAIVAKYGLHRIGRAGRK